MEYLYVNGIIHIYLFQMQFETINIWFASGSKLLVLCVHVVLLCNFHTTMSFPGKLPFHFLFSPSVTGIGSACWEWWHQPCDWNSSESISTTPSEFTLHLRQTSALLCCCMYMDQNSRLEMPTQSHDRQPCMWRQVEVEPQELTVTLASHCFSVQENKGERKKLSNHALHKESILPKSCWHSPAMPSQQGTD